MQRSRGRSGWLLVGLCAWSAIIGPSTAQEKPPAAVAGPAEAPLLALGARELGAFASLCTKNGFPQRGKTVWLEVLSEYADDDAAARAALGYYRHGSVWQRDPKFDYPAQDRPDAAAARMLEQRWKTLADKLADAHATLAAELAAAGAAERSRHHAQRALRFSPGHPRGLSLSGLQQHEGIVGDELDIAVLRRSRLLDRALSMLVGKDFPVAVSDDKLAAIDAAEIPYRAVKSEHFTVFGDWPPEVLQQAAQWAERSLAFCTEACAGHEGFPSSRPPSRQLLFFQQKHVWAKFVRKNLKGRDVEFVVQNAQATEVDNVETAAADTPEVVYDLAVRWVAQDYTGVVQDAVEEGVGHAVTGLFFGRNLVFAIGQHDPQGTVSGGRDQQKLMLPDLDTWRELAVELAWQKSGTAAARLPLLKAAQFPTDARIKAWSFCDFLLRVDPSLLRHLDATALDGRTEPDVQASFQRRAGRSLAELEERWRRFWTEDTPLRAAVLGKTTPLEAASKDAPAWLEQWNRVREQLGRKPVGWSAQLSIACKEHVDYLKANKDQRGPAAEATELPGKPGFANDGRTFAQTALVWTRDKDPKKAVESWLSLPGYRDALLNQNVDTIGIHVDGGLCVLDGDRGRAAATQVLSSIWPEAVLAGGRAKDPVPAAVDVELLGPELQRLLAAQQRGKQKQIGYPLSLHLYHAGRGSGVTCTVTCKGQPVAGTLVAADGHNRRTAAAGMWVFYPNEPLPRGVDVTAQWQWTGGSHTVTFATR